MNSGPKVGVGIVIYNDQAQFLLGKRLVEFGHGYYSFPGGHIEYMETIAEAAARETFEETGLIIKPHLLVPGGYTEDCHDSPGKIRWT